MYPLRCVALCWLAHVRYSLFNVNGKAERVGAHPSQEPS